MNNWVVASPYTVVDSLLKEFFQRFLFFLSPFLVDFDYKGL